MTRERYFSATREVFKGVLFVLCIYGTTDYAQAKENVDLSNRLAGRNHIYFTHLSLYMTIVTLLLSYLVKHFGISSMREIYRDTLSITMPIECLVTTIFWILNCIDPTLLKNRELYLAGVRTPLISELSLHLLPLVLLLSDQIGVKVYERKRHYWMFVSISSIYFLTIYYFHLLNKCWVYPFLDNMSMASRVALFAVSTLLVILYYKMCLRLSQLINKLFGGDTHKSKLI